MKISWWLSLQEDKTDHSTQVYNVQHGEWKSQGSWSTSAHDKQHCKLYPKSISQIYLEEFLWDFGPYRQQIWTCRPHPAPEMRSSNQSSVLRYCRVAPGLVHCCCPSVSRFEVLRAQRWFFCIRYLCCLKWLFDPLSPCQHLQPFCSNLTSKLCPENCCFVGNFSRLSENPDQLLLKYFGQSGSNKSLKCPFFPILLHG